MRACHKRPSAVFDDPNLVSCASLVPMVALAGRTGLPELVGEHVRVPGTAGSDPVIKVVALVAGPDSIDDMGRLRHGAMGRLFSAARAPSPPGTFLRAFAFAHVRQLDAVASRFLANLIAATRLRKGSRNAGCATRRSPRPISRPSPRAVGSGTSASG